MFAHPLYSSTSCGSCLEQQRPETHLEIRFGRGPRSSGTRCIWVWNVYLIYKIRRNFIQTPDPLCKYFTILVQLFGKSFHSVLFHICTILNSSLVLNVSADFFPVDTYRFPSSLPTYPFWNYQVVLFCNSGMVGLVAIHLLSVDSCRSIRSWWATI